MSKVTRFMVPSLTQGASRRSWRSAATKGEGRLGIDLGDQFSPERAKPRMGAPVAERRMIHQPLPTWCPAGGLGHVCFQPSLIHWLAGYCAAMSRDARKPMRSSICAMKGWRCVIQMFRWRATFARFCSSACRSFFVRQPQPSKKPPDRTGMGADTAFCQ